MTPWLVILLEAPFASFADQPGNTTRKTADMPTRSALLGLAGAALGVLREDAAGQAALSDALVTASALIEPGSLLGDFHTVQSVHQSAKGVTTRADALSRTEHVNTSITRRDYRTDALWQAAYRLSATPGDLTLEALASAFRRPVFALCIGRRSCPPCHPLGPMIVAAGDVAGAFARHRESVEPARRGAGKRPIGHPRLYSIENRADLPAANRASEHRRRDQPRDRSVRWTFAERSEWRIAGAADSGGTGHD